MSNFLFFIFYFFPVSHQYSKPTQFISRHLRFGCSFKVPLQFSLPCITLYPFAILNFSRFSFWRHPLLQKPVIPLPRFLRQIKIATMSSTNANTVDPSVKSGSTPPGIMQAVNEMRPKPSRKKLYGREFYESIGSLKMIVAPMVDRSEFVRFHH